MKKNWKLTNYLITYIPTGFQPEKKRIEWNYQITPVTFDSIFWFSHYFIFFNFSLVYVLPALLMLLKVYVLPALWAIKRKKEEMTEFSNVKAPFRGKKKMTEFSNLKVPFKKKEKKIEKLPSYLITFIHTYFESEKIRIKSCLITSHYWVSPTTMKMRTRRQGV